MAVNELGRRRPEIGPPEPVNRPIWTGNELSLMSPLTSGFGRSTTQCRMILAQGRLATFDAMGKDGWTRV